VGLFFNTHTPATRRTDAIIWFGLLQLTATSGDGLHTEASDECQMLITTVSNSPGFHAHKQSLLAFIQCAQEKIHPAMQVFNPIEF
jgi:hypothetical protein